MSRYSSFLLHGGKELNCNFFSKVTVGILEDLKAEYGTFDILSDDEVRQVFFILL